MIAHHAAMVVIVDVARVLIEQMPDLIAVVEHEHQRHDGKLSAGTCRQIPNAAFRIRLNGGNQLLQITTLNGFPRLGIHLAGILVTGIVGEVAAYDEEVFIREIGLQHLGYPL